MHGFRIFTIPAAALLGTASAAVLPRDALPFSVSGFYASGAPHSAIETVEFSVSGNGFATTCYGSVGAYQALYSVPETNCTDTTVSFSLDVDGTAATLNVNHHVSVDVIDSRNKYFPEGSVQIYQNPATPTGNYAYLSTSPTFDMTTVGDGA